LHLLGIGEPYEKIADMHSQSSGWFRCLDWKDNSEIVHVGHDYFF
jgi:hypothetical protein